MSDLSMNLNPDSIDGGDELQDSTSPASLACDQCDYVASTPSVLGIHKFWKHKQPSAKREQKAKYRAKAKSKADHLYEMRVQNIAKGREALAKKMAAAKRLGTKPLTRPALPTGKYYISPDRAQKMMAHGGKLTPGAVIWDPVKGIVGRGTAGSAASNASNTAAKTPKTPKTSKRLAKVSTQGATHTYASINSELVAYTVGKIENELYHIAEKHDIPAREFASAVGTYLQRAASRE